MELIINNLTKTYGDHLALSQVSMKLENGIYGLLGPNGAGKSTLISLLTDTVARESGEILYNGEDILKLGEEYRKVLGYMPQQQGFYEDFSATAFLMYMAQLKGIKKKEAKKKVEELLEVVNLSNYAHKKVGTFSGGMKQRVLLAQALLNNPKVLILDEPTAGLDPKERIHIRNFISKIASEKIVLLATHIVSDIESIAKEILLLKNGELLGQEEPGKLLEKIKEKVFEIEVPKEEVETIQNKFKISNLSYTPNGVKVKIVSAKPIEEYQWVQARASLEDVYLYYFE